MHSVRAELHREVLAQEQEQSLEPAVEQAAAELRRDAVADLARRQAASAARVLRADELAAVCRDAAAEQHEEVPVVSQDARQEPAVQPAGAEVPPLAVAEVLPSVPAEERLWEVQAARPSVAREVQPSAQHAAVPEVPLAAACAPVPFAVRPAPSSKRLARRGQIAKWKMRRSQARPVSGSSCRSLVLASCLSKKVHDVFASDASCPQWTDSGEAGVWRRPSPLRLFCRKRCVAVREMNRR